MMQPTFSSPRPGEPVHGSTFLAPGVLKSFFKSEFNFSRIFFFISKNANCYLR
jgi:hypothetical protein